MSRFIPLVVAAAGAIAAALLGPAPAEGTMRSAPQTAGGPVAAAPWRRPVTGSVVRPFAYDRGQPFARGARRGVDLRAAAGTPVRAPCSGRVTHAGAIPARRRGVTVQCGGLRATLLGLATTAVRRGARVRAGDRVGAAAGPTLRLGARESADAFGYIDPLVLLDPDPDPGPGGIPPLGRAPRGVRPPAPPAASPRAAPRPQPVAAPRPAAAPDTAPRPAPQAAPRSAPLAALLGIALLAAAIGAGRLTRRRKRPTQRRSPAAHRGAGRREGVS